MILGLPPSEGSPHLLSVFYLGLTILSLGIELVDLAVCLNKFYHKIKHFHA